MLRLAFGLWLLTALPSFAGYGPTVTPEEVRREFTYGRAVITGTVEGVTEYLPVSSTGHMIISDRLLGVPSFPDVTVSGVADRKGRTVSLERVADDYIVIIQLGAILAVFVAFFGRISGLLAGLWRGERRSVGLASAILLAFVPAALLGFLFKEVITAYLFSVEVVAAALLVGGLVILVAEHLLP
jgi:undecaprenyl-diphosphatase